MTIVNTKICQCFQSCLSHWRCYIFLVVLAEPNFSHWFLDTENHRKSMLCMLRFRYMYWSFAVSLQIHFRLYWSCIPSVDAIKISTSPFAMVKRSSYTDFILLRLSIKSKRGPVDIHSFSMEKLTCMAVNVELVTK